MNLLKKNKIESIFMIFGLFLISLLISCGDEKTDQIREKYKCDNFEDCLSKNEFNGAYEYYSLKKQEIEAKGGNSKLNNWLRGEGDELNKKYHQLINAQLSFWIKEKNFERAFNDENLQYNSEVTFYNNLLDDLINKMIIEGQPKEVLFLYCKSFKPIVKGDDNNKGLLGGFNSYVLSNDPYKLALEKINELEK
jgi:hypothetical protein